VEVAKNLLRYRESSLSEIALSCGFADQSHFTRVFTRQAGAGPGAWRRGLAALRGGAGSLACDGHASRTRQRLAVADAAAVRDLGAGSAQLMRRRNNSLTMGRKERLS
jgi:hypothetical protein